MTRASCIALCLVLPVVGGMAAASATPQDQGRPQLDRRSYNLGIIAGFSEVVGAGVKKLALSEALPPTEMAGLIDEANRIAARYNVRTFLEDDLIVTDLFPEDVAVGKQVLMLFQDPVLDEYRALKAEKARLVQTGAYVGAAREAIARKFGRLLSYSESHLDDLLRARGALRSAQAAALPIHGTLVFLYYKDLGAARRFYEDILGLPPVLDYGFAAIYRVSATSHVGLVDESRGMHKASEPKTVTVAFVTDEVDAWFDYLSARGVAMHRPLRSSTAHPTRGFVALDPEGYFLEFEAFLDHDQNRALRAALATVTPLYPGAGARPFGQTSRPARLGIRGTVFWLYYHDVQDAQRFYEDTLGLRLLVDQGYAKVYSATASGFVGLVDQARGLHTFSEMKAVNVVFQTPRLAEWYERLLKRGTTFRSPLGTEEGGLVQAFVALDPAGYFLEFHWFGPDPKNATMLELLRR